MTYLALVAILYLGKMHVHYRRFFETELIDSVIENAPVIVFGFESAAHIRINMPEIEAGIENIIDQTKVDYLFYRTYLIELAHRFRAQFIACNIVFRTRLCQKREIAFSRRNSLVARRFAARRRMKHYALAAQLSARLCRLQNISDRLAYHFRIGVCEICVIGRVHAYRYVALFEFGIYLACSLVGYRHTAPERILECGKSELRKIFRLLIRMFSAARVKRSAVARRSYPKHFHCSNEYLYVPAPTILSACRI